MRARRYVFTAGQYLHCVPAEGAFVLLQVLPPRIYLGGSSHNLVGRTRRAGRLLLGCAICWRPRSTSRLVGRGRTRPRSQVGFRLPRGFLGSPSNIMVTDSTSLSSVHATLFNPSNMDFK
jgi:hypothetical protein